MFERFRSNKDKPAAQDSKLNSQLPRGMEVEEVSDPETGWGMWDEATASAELRLGSGAPLPADTPPAGPTPMPSLGFPHEPGSDTQPMPLSEKSLAQQAEEALGIIELHHARIAKTIRMMWGYKECSAYIDKLLMTGYDDTGHARQGFHQEAVNAMMTLGETHDKLFGIEHSVGLGGFDGQLNARDHRSNR
ncbi:hypothetical protein RQP54_19565 [Curvibacter sp. APW13]|uniref:hypothetical protein n=1 Tax=Curvibacter sp. APW13 TaxID=3077236 RepID=UPI0028DDB243|nr:hypothetical protein [Curvibacter sp. APW13]MDT8993081.1 hypothetical protein [Curvibacter sp. APW13]